MSNAPLSENDVFAAFKEIVSDSNNIVLVTWIKLFPKFLLILTSAWLCVKLILIELLFFSHWNDFSA